MSPSLDKIHLFILMTYTQELRYMLHCLDMTAIIFIFLEF